MNCKSTKLQKAGLQYCERMDMITFAPVTTDSSAEDPKTTFLDDVKTDRPAIKEIGREDHAHLFLLHVAYFFRVSFLSPAQTLTKPSQVTD